MGWQLWRRASQSTSLPERRVASLTYLLGLGFGALSLGLWLPGFAAQLGGRSHPRSVLLGDAQPGGLDRVIPGGAGVVWEGAGRYPGWAGGLCVPHSTLPS